MRYEGLITKNEYKHICNVLKREPNDFELSLFSATYSEHCAYKHSKKILQELPREGAVYYNENAGGFEIGDHVILFKMESHNHPCAVEPYNGAATGVGGIIRDVLAMNARPIALCNSLKFGHDGRIQKGVVKGISDYSNSIGVPTVSTEVLHSYCFEENPLVNVTAIGIAKKSEVLVSNNAKASLKLMLVGSATMRDGMGGAAFASKELNDEKAEDKLSIQIANSFMKKKLIEACLEIFRNKLVVSCQDCGAAGILSSTSEVAFKSNCGVQIDLDKIHLGDKSILDYEIMLSETQERMLFVIEEVNIEKISRILDKYQLEYSVFGKTIDKLKFIVTKSTNVLADLPTDLLVTPPEIKINTQNTKKEQKFCNVVDANSKEIFEQYDHTVGSRTQLDPIDNPQYNSLWIYEENCYLGVYTFSCPICNNAYDDVKKCLIKAVVEIEKKGYTPMGLTNCLNFANPETPPTMYEFAQTISAIRDVCNDNKVPVCSGNVSLYNESLYSKIINTPTFTILGIKYEN